MRNTMDLYQFYQGIKQKDIIFCYSGPISQATVEGIGHTLKLDLEIEDAGFNVTQAIFSIFVEQMQNILNYSAEKVKEDTELDKELRIGVLVIGQEEGGLYVYCGNKVLSSDVVKLQEKIESIRSLNKDELKALYKEKRRQVPEEGSKGAGLGLIEMARKSERPMEYAFIPIDSQYSFFSIKVTIRRQKNG
jgi:hypothetical protein